LREVANLSARTAAAAEFRNDFRKALAIRLTPTILLFVLGGILVAFGAVEEIAYRGLAAAAFSLGFVALMNVLYFTVRTVFEQAQTPGIVRPAAPPATKTNGVKDAA
jgi:uncharacterized RDD family membrane protein YckC